MTELSRIERVDSRTIGEHQRINAVSALVHLEGNARPYFTVTGEVRDTRKRGDNAVISCGAIHDEVGRYFPDLAPIIALHLADDRGWPMHAVENAVYWSGLSVSRGPKPSTDGTCRTCGQAVHYPATPAELMVPGPVAGHEYETDLDGIVWLPTMLAKHLRVDVARAREMRAYVIAAGGSDRDGWRFVIRDLEATWQAEADSALNLIRVGFRS